ncbi:FAR1 DNA binding domain-containing protein [Artemisia annua]|uniref:FAR1 DNA binding domain-containing protein n=1 Tax=Artemisia annua TaxID=35608 RepID=A0A2U1M1I4_ARTAN|nr:FAR1 DNA binding domain-containing protein [Artemisia annua]
MNEETSETQIRTSSISRTGCMARVKFKLNESHTEYELYDFVKEHNHTFVPVMYRNLTKKKKKLTHREKMFMQQLGGTNIGATRAHHLYAATNGGYDEVDATETEFRNHTRDLNSHIGDSDAQMLINKMENRELAAAAGSSYVRDMMIVRFEREVAVLLLDEAELRKKAQEIRSRVEERDMVVGELEKLFAFDSTLQSISELSKLQTQELTESAQILVNVMKKQTRATELLAVIQNLKALPY